MKSIWRWLSKKSLARRLFLVFSLMIGVIWLGLIAWGYYSLKTQGLKEAQIDLAEYAKQLMVVVETFPHEPQRLVEAIKGVEAIENSDNDSLFSDKVRMQLWLNKEELLPVEVWPSQFPGTNGFNKIQQNGAEWWTTTLINEQKNAAVRIGGTVSGVTLALSIEQKFFLFLPLVISLPCLLVPIWLLTRSGLRPLTAVASQINERVLIGELKPLPHTPYRDIEPLVKSTNRLMLKINAQRTKEHEFVANVAHELKTPMAIMQANIGILQSNQSANLRKTTLDDLQSGIARANHLVHQLLRMARMEHEPVDEIQKRNIDVAEFLRERVALADSLAKKRGLNLILFSPDRCRVRIDTDGFAAIIDNLLDNAIKYSPEGENIEISLHVGDQGELRLTIKDNGEGIAPQEIDGIFARFKRSKSGLEASEGSGLGLAIAYQAGKRMGAQIKLRPRNNAKGLSAEVVFENILG